MASKLALIGNTVTEEVLADVIHRQSPDMAVDGYPTIPNDAFSRAVDENFPLFALTTEGALEPDLTELPRLFSGYRAIHVGGADQLEVVEGSFRDHGVDYIGPHSDEVTYETDKTKIFEVFPASTGVLPPTVFVESARMSDVRGAIAKLGGEVVVKFVGDYGHHFEGSAAGRTRMLQDFSDPHLEEFVSASIRDSGRVLLQQFIHGQQFSYTCLVDGDRGLFRLGENVCFKHRCDGETGPLTEGTGAVAINNTVPGLVSDRDLHEIAENIVEPFRDHLTSVLGRSPKTFLNLDFIKDAAGRLFLLEVNTRAPGGNTMANLINGLDTPIAEVLQATQEGRLRELTPSFHAGASVVVAAFPSAYPNPFPGGGDGPTLVIPKVAPDSPVRMYTGWVDVLAETDADVTAQAHVYTTMIVQCHAPGLAEARRQVYDWLAEVIPHPSPEGFDYRRDIGLPLPDFSRQGHSEPGQAA